MELERDNTLSRIARFISAPKAGFIFVRGRRRIGKSWLLRKICQERSNTFYFSGSLDSSTKATLKAFAEAWDKHTGKINLTSVKSSLLTWKWVFREVVGHLKNPSVNLPNEPSILIFDEIQWIASGRSGFIGDLKEAWVEIERETTAKVIVCGSSTKFFSNFVGGETKILRGLQTHSDIVVQEFSLGEVKRELVPNWRDREIALLYMMLGGVPYYLQRIDPAKGFVHAINDAIFTSKSIFLDEWREVISVDYNSRGVNSANRILGVLSVEGGMTYAEIAKAVGEKEDLVKDNIEKLREYGYVGQRVSYRESQGVSRNQRGARYYISDSYLQFYYTVLKRQEYIIRDNENGLIFPKVFFYPASSCYVPNFSGPAFEYLVYKTMRMHLCPFSSLAQKLQLVDNNFDIINGVTIRRGNTTICEIDILLTHREDRILRVIECKWAEQESLKHLQDTMAKTPPDDIAHSSIKRTLVTSYVPSDAFTAEADRLGITLINLGDLMGADRVLTPADKHVNPT